MFEEGEPILFFQILKSSAYNIYFPFPINYSCFLLIYQILFCMDHFLEFVFCLVIDLFSWSYMLKYYIVQYSLVSDSKILSSISFSFLYAHFYEWCKSALILEKCFLMQENKTVISAQSYHLYRGIGVLGIKWVWSQTWGQNIALHLKLQDE